MEIVNLATKMSYFNDVVDWLYDEWGTHGEKNNRVYWESWVKSSLSTQDVPQTYVAIESGELVATFSLWRCDLQSRQDLFPWFGGLYIDKRHRNKGYGKAMQMKALEILRELGYDQVYLFADFSGYYESTGWTFLGMVPDEKGNMVRLYSHTVN